MSGYDEALLKRARAHDAPNVTMDGHNDLPWALHDAYDHRLARFDLREPQGHIKIPKLRHQYLHTDFPREGRPDGAVLVGLRADDDPRRRGGGPRRP